MDLRKAQTITLLCAIISKYEKGVSRSLSPQLSIPAYRLLAHLSLPETALGTLERLAWAAVMRPVDVEAALDDLLSTGHVAKLDEGYHLTTSGQAQLACANHALAAYRAASTARLSPDETTRLDETVAAALETPGSFYGKAACLSRENLQPVHRMAVLFPMGQAMSRVVKKSAGLSLTDYRFLLELYPKRRGVVKRLRARDLVGFLRVGRSYVSTASTRLEEQGLIERIPDEQDARGVLYQLTPFGAHCVSTMGEDIYVVAASLLTDRIDERSFLLLLRHWLEGEDAALAIGEA
ncbi:MAG: winged helix-turn-helix transcriptional regulator [Adlercreutzia sp.]|nr:winged helix-turn-helix transcriptional regulator [Adlercreutzia sp.]